jgi:hypothetical protein
LHYVKPYLFRVAVTSLDFALASAFEVLLDLDLGADLVTLARVKGAVSKKNLQKRYVH